MKEKLVTWSLTKEKIMRKFLKVLITRVKKEDKKQGEKN